MKSKLFRLFAMLVVCSMIVTPVFAQAKAPAESRPTGGKLTPASADALQPQGLYLEKQTLELSEAVEVVVSDGPATYIVFFEGTSLVAAHGGAAGLDAKSADSQAYLNTLAAARESILAQAQSTLGRKLEIGHVYDVILNAAAIKLTLKEAAIMEQVPGVRKVLKDTIEYLTTDVGPSWIGAPTLWDGTAVPDGSEVLGDGVVAGILDTGINFDHPSFSPTPDDGYIFPTPAKYLGVCDPTNLVQYDILYKDACNDKVIGAYTYTEDSLLEPSTPEDSEGHGSHTASTVAGNIVDLQFEGVPVTVSGVAPHAQIISYDVCYPTPPNGACEGNDSVAAVQQAILDGVDVINFSISGGGNPYSDAVELAFLEAFDAGVFVSTSAGNAGDTTGPSSVAHRGPWVATVAAASHDRLFAQALSITGPVPVGAGLTELAAVPGSGPSLAADIVDMPIRYSTSNQNGCVAFPAGTFTDAIALIVRGSCDFSVKVGYASAAGAELVVVYNNRPGAPISMGALGATTVPAVMIDQTSGLTIKAWIDAHPDATASLPTEVARLTDAGWGDIVAGFSSYGPNTSFDVLKPDITAPGVAILAAVADSTITPSGDYELALYQGTSMSSPHNAGSAALLIAQHPDWTPAMVKSALMMTAEDGLIADRAVIEGVFRPATPQDEGAGRVALEFAGLVGLVMNETTAKFEAADPAVGGNPASLNVPSLYNSQCVGECSWTRTFTSVAGLPATYTAVAPAFITVTPATFTIAPSATQVVTFTADVSAFDPGAWVYDKIVFTTDDTHPGDVVQVLSEDFETWPAAGWTIAAADGSCDTWLGSETTEYPNQTGASGFFADANSDFCGDAMDTWMVSPAMDLTGFTTVSLSFASDFNDYNTLDDGYVDVSTNGVDWTNVLHYDGIDVRGPRTVNVDLSAYAGQSAVQVRFHYTAADWDWYWQVDHVVVNGISGVGPVISNVHIPAAILPTASNLPDLIKFNTYRDADSGMLEDIIASEITDLTVDVFGLTKADLASFTLDPDQTNGDAFDDLNQVWWTNLDVPAYTVRLVAEITKTTSSDLDLFIGYDFDGNGLPSSDEVMWQSATGAALEYINLPYTEIMYDVDLTFWVLVQNWAGAAGDTVTMATGAVPLADNGNLVVTGPETNPAGEPFKMDVLWNEDTEEGDRLYGIVDVYADNLYDVELGMTDIDIRRGPDDVTKTVDGTTALIGDILTYTITINNPKPTDLTYTIEDPLPAGLTYIPGSATNGAVYDTVNNKITWSGLIPGANFRDYIMTTSLTDANCAMPLANSGGYVNLNGYGLNPDPSVTGEGTWGWTTSGNPISFYGQNVGNTIQITDDAFAYLGAAVTKPAANADIPDLTLPNNLLAYFWRDLVVTYDAATVKGVSLANLNVATVPVAHIVEMDDVSLKSDPTKTYDTEFFISKAVDDTAGEYEVVFAYDNINGPLDIGSIGVENGTGTVGTKYSYNDATLGAITNGMAICFDYQIVPPPATVITFQVVMEQTNAATLTNTAIHDNDALGTVLEGASVTIDTPATSGYPNAIDDEYSMLANGVLEVPADGVLVNDIYSSLDGHSVSLVTETTHGVITLYSDGSFLYVPESGYVGVDTFVYELVTYPSGDKAPWTDQATVTITVNPLMMYFPIIFR